MGEFIFIFCLLCLVVVIFAGGKSTAEGLKSAFETQRDPDILIEERMKEDEHWTWQPEVKQRRKCKYEVVDAYMTKSIHFAIELQNRTTDEHYTVYGKLPAHAEAKADAIIHCWALQELNGDDGSIVLPKQPHTGDRVT